MGTAKKTRSNKKAVALLLLFIEKEKDHLLTLLSFHTEEERRRIHSFTHFLIKLCQNKVGVIEAEVEKRLESSEESNPGPQSPYASRVPLGHHHCPYIVLISDINQCRP